MRRREFIAALLMALSASFGFWYYKHVAFEAPLSKEVDLSEPSGVGQRNDGLGGFSRTPEPVRHEILFVATDNHCSSEKSN